MDKEQKEKLTFIGTIFIIIIIFVLLFRLGVILFFKDFDYLKVF